ncbi:methyltransferase family protein [Rhodopseudomonas thermotolerans]|uniref:Methyltransferase family protein n=2 Tax=Rhodopseudomonas TaxID=1073 RepID=A0A336JKL9_9BRAD|nr:MULTISPECIES: class I SAM-dependent methyltransferase [Rhodopseudomonas]RED37987.1 methyltransferase family protein [Rhodopseudomonas pentothenatexigens]REG05180.1 methyltransferase family protein [Rhodopseudomonas thermotolerans]SSW90012.1 methyltransferase family protein [Rhodopseudomonas pentothenatexigens]
MTGIDKLAVRLRLRLPANIRHLARVARFAVQSGRQSPALPQALLENCRFCADRLVMVERLPHGGVVAEIGCLRGEFSRDILRLASPKRLHLFDIDFSPLAADVRADHRVSIQEGPSPESLAVLPDGSLDWAYIDADHSYAAVVRDAAAAARKVKPGGYLVFNDFAHVDPFLGRYGVHRAVVEFAVQHRWEVAFFAYETNAVYDIALRRPDAAVDPRS